VPMVKASLISRIIHRLIPYRLWIQLTFLVAWLTPLRWFRVCSPVFHCYACPLATFACPIGVLAQFSALHVIPFVTLGILVLVGATMGTMVCGWMCPFGLLQDLAARVPWRKWTLPAWVGYGRYVVLTAFVLAIPYFFGEGHALFICRICPAGALEAAVPSMVQQALAKTPVVWPNAIKLSILGVFLIAIFVVKRPWCRVLCPLGGLFGLFNRVSLVYLDCNKGACTDCKRCHKLCDVNCQPDEKAHSGRCVRCFECTKCGPKALAVKSVLDKPTL
jgi:ferredoxin-type protein NapH